MRRKENLNNWNWRMRVIISGGGTGGHVFPAIAIADAIRSLAPDTEILFVGAIGKLEMEKVPKAGYKIEGLNVTGFQRKMTLKNIVFPFRLAASLWKARQIVRRFKPDVVVGVGGYASGPVLKMANMSGIKTVLQEQNSFAGVTNRLLADKAIAICVAYDEMERFFPADRIIFTGNPVRKQISEGSINAEDGRKYFGLDPESPVALIFGGSLGAKALNEAVFKNIEKILSSTSVNLIWQAGGMYYDSYRSRGVEDSDRVKLLPFIENMEAAYAAADLVVCRAGALTISELAVLGKAAVLVPSPNVAEDHQTVNAMSLVRKNAALMVKDSDAASQLGTVLTDLLADENKRKDLQKNINFFARPDAAVKIAEIILKAGKR
jgi:UDP-N-acetylglucosamine--N-acetylmuramyl-(pentapeptide) pyrophosphoryl-undecaprenol N-acetylglucosamine transferase